MKKAELTTQQIVTIIILIICFAVVLYLLYRLNLGETNQKEICHNSVLLRSKSIFGGKFDCATTYVCISGGNDCKEFSSDSKIEIDLSKSDDEIKKQLFNAIANEMLDCWWMFGEGKVDYQGWLDKNDKFTDWTEFHCAICSQIKFDEKLQEKFSNQISYEELYNYLYKTEKDKTQSYLNYLYGEIYLQQKSIYPKEIIGQEKISLSDEYYIVTGSEASKGEDTYIPPYFVKFDELKTKTGCEVFDITRA